MNKQSVMTLLWFAAGILWLIAFFVMDNGARIMALFCAFMFLFVAFRRLWQARKAS